MTTKESKARRTLTDAEIEVRRIQPASEVAFPTLVARRPAPRPEGAQ